MLRVSMIAIGIMLMMAGMAIRCYSEDSSEINRTVTIQGAVIAIDWVGAVFTVNDVVFSIPSSAEVVKGTERVSFSDIDVGDNVTVTYNKENDGSLRVSRVAIAYSGEFPI